MRILIFEDNHDDMKNLLNCLEIFLSNYDLKYEIKTTDCIDYVLKNVKEFDIFFLDIEVNHQNGIELGMEIRTLNKTSKIIFISNYSKYLIDGYKAEATRYFLKPINQDFFNMEMKNVLNDYLCKFDGFYDDKVASRKVYFHQILYIEFLNKRSYLHLKSGNVIKTSYSLKHWKELLPFYFAQPYKSFVVNLNYISGFKKMEIILDNEAEIPISRKYKKEFEEHYSRIIERLF